MPSRNGETKRETRVAKVSQEAVGRQLSRLPVAGRNMQRMLPKSAARTPGRWIASFWPMLLGGRGSSPV